MSYQISAEEALFAAGRVVKETGAAAIKLEGGVRVAETIAKIVDADIPVMGHVGLTPQSVHKMGGYKVQGRQTRDARKLIDDAIAVEEAGAFALVLEGMPAELAREITETVDIPTIGIGAGKHCSGQVLVMHDLLGITPVDGEHVPKFVKRFAGLKDDIVAATEQYVGEVKNATFPGEEHSYEYSSKKVSGLRPVQK